MLFSNFKIFNNKNIFITGGTGSFGSNFIKTLLTKSNPKKIICFSRDELKQFDLQNNLKKIDKKLCVRFFIGDVRDKDRLNLALLNNKIDRSERSKQRFQRYDIVKLSDKRRPIYAVLTEPMKSDVLKR